jgi:hypothetical protein
MAQALDMCSEMIAERVGMIRCFKVVDLFSSLRAWAGLHVAQLPTVILMIWYDVRTFMI